MADNNVTESQTNDPTQQAAAPEAAKHAKAAPTPAAIKAHAPSPAAFAKNAKTAPAAKTGGFAEQDSKEKPY